MLYEALSNYIRHEHYPFHMPGHKQQKLSKFFPYEMDITEITGFDHLHSAEGILLEEEHALADLYGCKEAKLLVNGATCGILSAVYALAKEGDTIWMSRNCHQSVYHAAALRHLRVNYLHVSYDSQFGVTKEIDAKEVEAALKKHPAKLLIITSPSYDGTISDLFAIVKIAHQHGTRVVIDAAHGAHLGLFGQQAKLYATSKADAVVVSLHKTLPFLTQTAALLLPNGNQEDIKAVEQALRIFETSSPSYILLAAASYGIQYLQNEGKDRFLEFYDNLNEFYQQTKKLTALKIYQHPNHDPSKIVMTTPNDGEHAKRLADILRKEYQIETEMTTFTYCLALSSVMDTKEGFERLANALLKIDQNWIYTDKSPCRTIKSLNAQTVESVVSMGEALQLPQESCGLTESEGRISGDFVGIYPPGTLVLAPGERIKQEQLDILQEAIRYDFSILGFREGQLSVLRERDCVWE